MAIRAAGLCHSDQSVINGTIPYPVPVVLGHEGAGVVESVGPGVTSVKEGDAVILSTLAHCGRCPACEGGKPTACRNAPNPKDVTPFSLRGAPVYQFANASAFAELTLVREQSAIPVDPRVPFDRAALIGCGIMTGVGAVLNRARVEAGSSMAVFGVGGIGLNCVQGGVLAGAAQIIAVDVNPQKLELARQLRRHARRRRVARRRARRPCATSRAAAPTTPSSASATWPSSARRSTPWRPAARSPSSACRASAPPWSWWCTASTTTRRILGCRYGAARPRRDFPMLADLYLAGRLRIDELITDRYPLDDFDRALHDLEDGRLARGVFHVGGSH